MGSIAHDDNKNYHSPDTVRQEVSTARRVRVFLLKQADKQQENLRLFVIGAALFFAGTGLIIYADNAITPSLSQESVTLAGVIIAALGIATAAIGYIALSVLRFIKILDKND